jgi:hypothetical protein
MMELVLAEQEGHTRELRTEREQNQEYDWFPGKELSKLCVRKSRRDQFCAGAGPQKGSRIQRLDGGWLKKEGPNVYASEGRLGPERSSMSTPTLMAFSADHCRTTDLGGGVH